MADSITDPPPAAVVQELTALRSELDQAIPAKRLDDNLLIATWNLRAFGGLTEKWRSAEGDSPKRDLHALRCIAEIVARFDVIAIQEVKDDIKALRHMLKVLGPDWGLIMTDVTLGSQGNDERMAFVFDTRRVKPSGLAGELVVPPEWQTDKRITEGALTRQFARTPYAVSFVADDQTFILVTLHVIYGEKAADRAPELKGIAEWLADWARREKSWGHNLIALGDFNIDRKGDANFQAFTSTGLRPPVELDQVPRTIFASGKESFYDQIAWFTEGVGGGAPALSLRFSTSGSFDFTQTALSTRKLTKTALSWQISDHYPLWAEFITRTEFASA